MRTRSGRREPLPRSKRGRNGSRGRGRKRRRVGHGCIKSPSAARKDQVESLGANLAKSTNVRKPRSEVGCVAQPVPGPVVGSAACEPLEERRMYVTDLVIPVPGGQMAAYRSAGRTQPPRSSRDCRLPGDRRGLGRQCAQWPGRPTSARRWRPRTARRSSSPGRSGPTSGALDEAEAKMHEDSRLDNSGEPPFDAKRLIAGGFSPIFHRRPRPRRSLERQFPACNVGGQERVWRFLDQPTRRKAPWTRLSGWPGRIRWNLGRGPA